MKHLRFRTASAFTLLEMLVVFAIGALLLALGFGSYSKMQANQRSTACLSNMRQIGLSMLLYAGENNAQLPGPLWRGQSPLVNVDAEGAADVTSGNLASFLAPYIKVQTRAGSTVIADVFACPAWKRAPHSDTETICYYSAGAIKTESEEEELTPFGNPSSGDNEPIPPARLSSLPDTASTAALWEFDRTITGAAHFYNSDPRVPSQPVHKNTRTVLYFDAHVQVSSANAVQ